MNNPFKTTQTVRFEHCDPAGLIFYPRYFQLSHQIIEDWFLHGLGISHGDMVVNQKIGIPTVHVEANFLAASRLEEILEYSLMVEKLGRSSVTLNIQAHHHDELRCQMKQIIVFSKLDTEPVQSLPIPEEIRNKMAQFQMEAGN